MTSTPHSPWHAGERALQQRAGVAERMAEHGAKVIRDFMPEQHRQFFRQLPFLALGVVDAAGNPWASLVEARANLADSPDPRTLRFNALPGASDPARAALLPGAALGVLGIELSTRRRNRANGKVVMRDENGFTLHVEHSFGNCPQYIQLRRTRFVSAPTSPTVDVTDKLLELDADAVDLISRADTFFVASYVDLPDGTRQVDVSHRGGKPGFVRIDGQVLTIPDFAGNLHFNTLGNLHQNPKAGLLFVDFSNGDMLQLTGRAELVFDTQEVSSFQGAERIWRLQVEQLVRRRGALRMRASLEGVSPNCLMTGSWQQAGERQAAHALRNAWRRFRVTDIVDESATIKSFHLAPCDGAGLATFSAGQHLPVRLALAPGAPMSTRSYTLSVAPSDASYRISVKCEGAVSHHLHTQLKVGDEIEARAPQGAFVVDPHATRPLVLLSAGVGITPMLAMLKTVVYEGLRTRSMRPTYFVHAARSMAERAFDAELRALQTQAGAALTTVRVLSAPEPAAVPGRDYEVRGRIDLDLLKALLPFDDFDFYLCGPSAFTQDLYDGLRALRIPDERIHAESFGPSALRRSLDAPGRQSAPAASVPVPVAFAQSAKEARWIPGGGSLLELAEARGLTPDFDCRNGSCGSCKTKLLAGAVSYPAAPALELAAGEVLICCAVPSADSAGGIVLGL